MQSREIAGESRNPMEVEGKTKKAETMKTEITIELKWWRFKIKIKFKF